MINNDVNARYKSILAAMKKEIPELLLEIGGTPAKYYRIFRGEVKPNYDTLYELLNRYPEINGDWLLTGRGEMFITDIDKQVKEVEEKLKAVESENESLKSREKAFMTAIEKMGKDRAVTNKPKIENLLRRDNPKKQQWIKGVKAANESRFGSQSFAL